MDKSIIEYNILNLRNGIEEMGQLTSQMKKVTEDNKEQITIISSCWEGVNCNQYIKKLKTVNMRMQFISLKLQSLQLITGNALSAIQLAEDKVKDIIQKK